MSKSILVIICLILSLSTLAQKPLGMHNQLNRLAEAYMFYYPKLWFQGAGKEIAKRQGTTNEILSLDTEDSLLVDLIMPDTGVHHALCAFSVEKEVRLKINDPNNNILSVLLFNDANDLIGVFKKNDNNIDVAFDSLSLRLEGSHPITKNVLCIIRSIDEFKGEVAFENTSAFVETFDVFIHPRDLSSTRMVAFFETANQLDINPEEYSKELQHKMKWWAGVGVGYQEVFDTANLAKMARANLSWIPFFARKIGKERREYYAFDLGGYYVPRGDLGFYREDFYFKYHALVNRYYTMFMKTDEVYIAEVEKGRVNRVVVGGYTKGADLVTVTLVNERHENLYNRTVTFTSNNKNITYLDNKLYIDLDVEGVHYVVVRLYGLNYPGSIFSLSYE